MKIVLNKSKLNVNNGNGYQLEQTHLTMKMLGAE